MTPHNDATVSRIAGCCFPTPVKLPAATDRVKRQNVCTVIPYLQNSRSSNSRQASMNRDVCILSAGLWNFPQICKYLHLATSFVFTAQFLLFPPAFTAFSSTGCLPWTLCAHPLLSLCRESHTIARQTEKVPFWHASCTNEN